ncbi:MAG TPA: 30S ribosomal protein S6 [Solirubrobacteraceae bacterium]|nr:30S ribosomal protein S6 [Solirubrobacteraceae bacterium]
MTLPAPTYDLTLLLDPDAEEATRAKIVADARAAIEARGELERLDEWGTRPLSYPIDRRRAADYYLLQFHASTPELLAELQRSLRITDGILRFRLIKLKPGVPPAPDLRASAPTGRGEAPAPAPAPEAGMVEVEGIISGVGEAPAADDAQPAGAGAQAVPPQEAAPPDETLPGVDTAGEHAPAGEAEPDAEAAAQAGEPDPGQAS